MEVTVLHDCQHEMQEIINAVNNAGLTSNPTDGPTQLLPYLYIGNLEDAYNLGQLTELGITHVLDCSTSTTSSHTLTSGLGTGGYSTVYRRMCLGADDDLQYQIINDFDAAFCFIEDACRSDGKILVHCVQGINRSATVCIAYMLATTGAHLCDVVREVTSKRNATILSNPSFRNQLEQFARTLEKRDNTQ